MDDLLTEREKRQRNARVQARYDALMSSAKHGHYETMFKIVREEIEAERERCAKVAEEFYPSIIRCEKSGNVEHVRLHVETKWCEAIATAIRRSHA